MIEGSAVVKGSNPITPTISVEAVTDTSTKSESSTDDDTQEPPNGTQKKVRGRTPQDLINFYKNLD